MAGCAPNPIVLSALQKALLERIVRRQTSAQRLVERAKLILVLAKCTYNQEAGRRLGTSRQRALKWRQRWLEAEKRLQAVEAKGEEKELLATIEEVLLDAPGRGVKPKFTAEQVCQIVAVACERPEDSGRPISSWSHRELAAEVIKRGIVKEISPRQTGRFLKGGRHQASPLGILAESKHRRLGAIFSASH